MTEQKAKALFNKAWWKKFPKATVAALQLAEPRLCMPFGDFHRAVSESVPGCANIGPLGLAFCREQLLAQLPAVSLSLEMFDEFGDLVSETKVTP